MNKIELANYETLKQFHVGDNVMYVGKDATLFGTVTGFELTGEDVVWANVDFIVYGEAICRCVRPGALSVIK